MRWQGQSGGLAPCPEAYAPLSALSMNPLRRSLLEATSAGSPVWRVPGGRVSFRGEPRGVNPRTEADEHGMARADVIIENGTVVSEGGVFPADVVIVDERIAALTLDASDWSAPERIDATGTAGYSRRHRQPHPLRGTRPRLLEGFASGGAGRGRWWAYRRLSRCPRPIRPRSLGTAAPEAAACRAARHRRHGPVGRSHWPSRADRAAISKGWPGKARPRSSRSWPRRRPSSRPSITRNCCGRCAQAARLNLPYGLHAEDHQLLSDGLDRMQVAGRKDPLAHAESRPPLVETVAVNTALLLAAETGCHVHICHAASVGALALIREAKERGVHVTAETCPQYLMLNTDDLVRLAGFARCAPALREQAEVDGIWEYVLDGTIDLVCSDHCPYTVESKQAGHDDIFQAPLGLSGVQTLLPAFFSEAVVKRGLPVERFVALIAANPARIFGLYPRKGTLSVGADADIALLDPDAIWTVTRRRRAAQAEVDTVRRQGDHRPRRAYDTARRDDLRRYAAGRRPHDRPSRVRQVPAPRIWRDDVTLNVDANGRWIDPRRVESSIQELSQYGAHGETGVARLVYSPEWVAAQDQVAVWMEEAGLRVERDAVGNVLGLSRRPRPRAAHRGHRLTHRQSKPRRAF